MVWKRLQTLSLRVHMHAYTAARQRRGPHHEQRVRPSTHDWVETLTERHGEVASQAFVHEVCLVSSLRIPLLRCAILITGLLRWRQSQTGSPLRPQLRQLLPVRIRHTGWTQIDAASIVPCCCVCSVRRSRPLLSLAATRTQKVEDTPNKRLRTSPYDTCSVYDTFYGFAVLRHGACVLPAGHTQVTLLAGLWKCGVSCC